VPFLESSHFIEAKPQNYPKVFLLAGSLSLLAHLSLGTGTLLLPPIATQGNKVITVNVRIPPTVAPTAAPTVAPKIIPTIIPQVVKEKVVVEKKTTKPRIDKAAPKNDIPPPEVAGISESSLAKPGTGTGSFSAAVGNSAIEEVKPEQANQPPPTAYNPTIEDPDANPVVETVAEVESKCPYPPNLQLTEDAINAGILSGKIEVVVFVSSQGEVKEAKLKKKTGFEIDNVVLNAVKNIKCSPAQVAGKPVAVKEKVLKFEIRE
jgi:Gram-negative bacterial TonB protein C-terminal